MFFTKKKEKSRYVKSKNPELRKKQKAAIAAYYIKRRNKSQ